jgi:hypothetical protein
MFHHGLLRIASTSLRGALSSAEARLRAKADATKQSIVRHSGMVR